MRRHSFLTGYALARALPLAAIGAGWSFSTVFGRYTGIFAAAAIYVMCLLLINMRADEERRRGLRPVSQRLPAYLYAFLTGLLPSGEPLGAFAAAAAGSADCVLVGLLGCSPVGSGICAGVFLASAAFSRFAALPLLRLRAAAEITAAACAAGLAVCTSQRLKKPLSAVWISAGLAAGLLMSAVR